MTDAHTPGDYYIVTHNGRMTVKGPGAVSLADMYHPPSGSALGNARLFAAAPRLLEALKAILHTYDDGGTPLGRAFEMANVAIAQVEARQLPPPDGGGPEPQCGYCARRFWTREDLAQHVYEGHGGPKPRDYPPFIPQDGNEP